MKINLIAEIMGSNSGFAVHGRNLLKCLQGLGHEVSVECNLPKGWEAITDNETRDAINNNYNSELNIMIGHPHFSQYALSDKPKGFIQFLVFEGDKIPAFWVPILNQDNINQVWVASEDTKQAAITTGVKEEKIFIVSHGVDCEIFKPVEVEKTDNRFAFFANKGWSKGIDDRGGVAELLMAFNEEFGEDEPVKLLTKINSAYSFPGWDLQEEINKLGIDKKKNSNINIIMDDITEGKLNELYNQSDCFVNVSKGDAFGLGVSEALACGLPVLVTDKGGFLDFAKGNNVHYIKSELKPSPDLPTYEGINWNFPNKEDFKKKLREVYETYKGKDVDKIEIRNKIKGKFEWKNTSDKIKEALDKL